MKNLFKLVSVILILCLVAYSCSTTDSSVVDVDLTREGGGRVLHVNELMTDVKLVKLETGEGHLIGGYYQLFVGEKYILTLMDKSILQFDINGKFIRSLGRQGKGPGEFTGVGDYGVSPDESKLYIYHWGKQDYLLGFDLNTGEILPLFKLPYKDIGEFFLANDHILFHSRESSTREIYTATYEGELIDSLVNNYQVFYGSYAGRGHYMKALDKELYYFQRETDTLFILEGVEKIPAYNFKVNKRYDFESELGGNLLMIQYQTDNKMYLTVSKMNVERKQNSVINRIERRSFYLFNPKDNTVENISGFYHDYFDLELDVISISNNGSNAYMKYSAVDFKELLTEASENKKLDKAKAAELKLIDSQMNENDNPVLLIGRVAK